MLKWELYDILNPSVSITKVLLRRGLDMCQYTTVNLKATGENIVRLRKSKGLSVKQLQEFFGFEQPQAIYKWQRGESLPTVDNLYALSKLLETTIDAILVGNDRDFFVFKHRKIMKILNRKMLSIIYENDDIFLVWRITSFYCIMKH